MSPNERQYIAIDLKSFYASVECVHRSLDPLTTNLVVADPGRTEKTICLAVSPSLKALGIGGRPRLFEVIQRVNEVNVQRRLNAPNHTFKSKSFNNTELVDDPSLELDFITAPPQMALYMKISAHIYGIYLRYIAPEDIHAYSVDEVFIYASPYLKTYNMTTRELAMMLIRTVLKETGITATAGIGTNLYLCKIAMDITAKHMPPDKDGVRIAELDEMSYRKNLWSHTPLTDFWRIGRGYAERLEEKGLYTMGDIARCSLGKKDEFYNEELLYKLFGINAELLIDHAWGWESCTMEDIKSYKPESSSISSGQVLQSPYPFEKGRLIVLEMTDLLVLDLVEKGLLTNQIVLTVGYDVENLAYPDDEKQYKGEISIDFYGRKKPKSAHGSINLNEYTSSSKNIMKAAGELYDRIVDRSLTVKRMYVVANNVLPEAELERTSCMQLNFFSDFAGNQIPNREKEKERALQKALLAIKRKYGKNAVIKGMNLEEGATTIERNQQLGGHKA